MRAPLADNVRFVHDSEKERKESGESVYVSKNKDEADSIL